VCVVLFFVMYYVRGRLPMSYGSCCHYVDRCVPSPSGFWLYRCRSPASLVPLGLWLYRWWISAFSSSCRVLVVVYVDHRLLLPATPSLYSFPVSSIVYLYVIVLCIVLRVYGSLTSNALLLLLCQSLGLDVRANQSQFPSPALVPLPTFLLFLSPASS